MQNNECYTVCYLTQPLHWDCNHYLIIYGISLDLHRQGYNTLFVYMHLSVSKYCIISVTKAISKYAKWLLQLSLALSMPYSMAKLALIVLTLSANLITCSRL